MGARLTSPAAPAVSIFERMSGLARAHGAINLGQGYPDFGWPVPLLERAAALLTEASNQYPPMRGLPELRAAVAAHYGAAGPDHVLVASGASEALAAAILAFVKPGDTVAVFEPLYDLYLPMIRRAGGVARVLRLEAPGFALTPALIAAAFADPAPVMAIVNTPHNPTATVIDAAMMALVAAAAERAGAIVLADEVWEAVLFDGRTHASILDHPGCRAIKVGSAGKMFSLTGWKVGWAVGAPELIEQVAAAHQYLTFTTPPNLQGAVAWGLATLNTAPAMRAALERGRDRLAAGLAAVGYVTLPSAGSYFLTVDLAASGVGEDDQVFAERATVEHGVASIPLSAFYDHDPPRGHIRLCFAKADATLDEAVARLAAARAAFGR